MKPSNETFSAMRPFTISGANGTVVKCIGIIHWHNHWWYVGDDGVKYSGAESSMRWVEADLLRKVANLYRASVVYDLHTIRKNFYAICSIVTRWGVDRIRAVNSALRARI